MSNKLLAIERKKEHMKEDMEQEISEKLFAFERKNKELKK